MGITAGNEKSNVNIQLPIKVDYRALDNYLQKKFTGKVLSKRKNDKESTDQARVRKIALRRSGNEDFDLALHLQLTLLTTILRNKEINAVVHLDIEFREVEQEVYIHHYEIEGENSWVMNKLLETLINSIAYSRLKKKMKLGLEELVEKQVKDFNSKLSDGMELRDGIWLSGKMNKVRIKEIIPGMDHLLVSVGLAGNNLLEIKEINI